MRRAACILIIEKGKVLGVSRKDNPDDWGLIGGKCEEGESFEDAARRELYEETNLRAHDLLQVFQREDTDYVVITYMPEKYYGTIATDEEQEKKGEGKVAWITLDKLMSGSFGEYNRNLFKSLGLIK